MIRWLIALSMCSGCISIPPERTGVADDAGIDAATPNCYPETENCQFSDIMGISTVYTAVTADIDLDGDDDLIVTHIGQEPGIFVTYGPLDSSDGPQHYDEHIETNVQPVALAVADVAGDAHLDIVVFGQPRTNSNGGQIEIFEKTGNGSPSFSFRTSVITGFAPSDGALPVHIAIGEFDGDANGQKIVVADLSTIEMYNAENLSNSIAILNNDTAWSAINKLLPYSDGLLIVDDDHLVYRLANGDLETSTIDPEFTIRTAELFDIDGDNDLDLVGAFENDIGAYFNPMMGANNSGFPDNSSTTTPIDEFGEIWQLSIVPFQTPKLAFFEQTGNQSGVLYSSPLDFINDALDITMLSTRIILGFLPVVAVVTTSGQYRILSADGQSRCFVPSNNTLVSCLQ